MFKNVLLSFKKSGNFAIINEYNYVCKYSFSRTKRVEAITYVIPIKIIPRFPRFSIFISKRNLGCYACRSHWLNYISNFSGRGARSLVRCFILSAVGNIGNLVVELINQRSRLYAGYFTLRPKRTNLACRIIFSIPKM